MFKWLRRRFEKPIPLTTREREALARENDEAHRQAMGDPAYGTFSSLRGQGTYYVATAGDNLAKSVDAATDERTKKPVRPNIS